jgi:hypothetical protein
MARQRRKGGVPHPHEHERAQRGPVLQEYRLPEYQVGDRLRLQVREPVSPKDARADALGNYQLAHYVGEVEAVGLEADLPRLEVRWHLPACFGYDTDRGTVSTLVHVANGVWLEARKRPRNVAVLLEKIAEEEYGRLLAEARTR